MTAENTSISFIETQLTITRYIKNFQDDVPVSFAVNFQKDLGRRQRSGTVPGRDCNFDSAGVWGEV